MKYHGDRSTFVLSNAKLKFLNTKLLWGWNFLHDDTNIKLIKEENTEKYGSGFYYYSDAALAHYFKKTIKMNWCFLRLIWEGPIMIQKAIQKQII